MALLVIVCKFLLLSDDHCSNNDDRIISGYVNAEVLNHFLTVYFVVS